MADKKRKNKDETTNKNERSSNKMMKHKHSNSKKGGGRGDKGKRTGPHLPNALRREVDRLNPTSNPLLSDEETDSDDANDIYEYEEAIPEEESRKNRRYDSIENFEYQLPDQFKDENVESDDEDDVDDFGGMKRNLEGDTDEEEDEKRHARMLQDVSGLPSDVFEGRKRKNNIVISEAYPENEYNPSGDVLDGNTNISIHDLLGPLHGKTGINKLKKSVHQVEAKSTSLDAPLSKPDRERLERIATYGISKKDITRWEPLIKRNREATTIYFDQEKNVGFSTVGAIASDFEPRTAFEKQMAALVNNNEVADAHKNDGARLLELNKISVEEVKDRQNHLAKMRNLLFQHEMKAKRVKKIKSKTYHRLLKKDRLKATANEIAMDPEAAKELAKKQEFKRAQERLTLKHKNKNKWAKRIIERGVQDEGTKAAIAEQLHQHALLTRKMNTMRDNDSSSDDDMSSDDDDNGVSTSLDQEGASKLLERAKKKTLELLEDDDEMPKSGVHSLPFMVRGSKKRKAATEEEAKLALDEYESSLKQLEDESNGSGLKTGTTSSGRRVFGAPKQQVKESSKKKIRSDNYYGNTDSEDEFEAKEDVGHAGRDYLHKDVDIDPDILREESEIRHDNVFKSFDEIVKDPGPKTAYEVALFANDSWQKKKNLPQSAEQMKSENKVDANGTKSSQVVTPALQAQEIEELENDSDTDGEVGMVDGILTSVNKSTYELPSQADLIRRAFAGDDVEEEFVKDKEEMLNEENPEPEKPILLPGWGQWTHVQKKRGLPNWMVAEHENAKKKREEALRKRKDAHLTNVIISEKVDKKAEKLHTKTLPYPYTSKEVFEQSIRMPIGPEFNPATAIGALNRPEVVKKSGVIIKPIKFKEVNPHGRGEHKQSGQKGKGQKRKK